MFLVKITRKLHNYYYRAGVILISVFGDKKVICNLCGWRGKNFCHKDCGFGHLYLNSTCPYCSSQPRHRLILLYLASFIYLKRSVKLLHFAPEKYLTIFFKRYSHIDYLSVDIDEKKAMAQEDITELSFPDNSFDIIICSHVLEHVVDDHKAMKEMYRVLKPTGIAIIDVPIDISREETYEDLSITDPKSRTRAYFQWDHVRLYGLDFTKKLSEVSFLVESKDFKSSLDKKIIEKFGLDSATMYICKK